MKKKLKVHIINGPNLNLTGVREPEMYGNKTLNSIMALTQKYDYGTDVTITHFQSNHEGALIDEIQKNGINSDLIIINAGGYTHTSVSLRDALLAVNVPFGEVHITNIFAREEFRHKSMFADRALCVISGGGQTAYILGIIAGIDYLNSRILR